MTDAGLSREEIKTAYREKAGDIDDSGAHKTAAVMDLLQNRLKKHDDPLDQNDEISIAGEVVRETAEETGDVDGIIAYIDQRAGNIASKTSLKNGTDRITGGISPALRELKAEFAREEMKRGDGRTYTLENGTAVDEFLETHLDEIQPLTTTDHVDDIAFRFIFDNDIQVELGEGEHLEFQKLYEALQSATAQEQIQLRSELASEKAMDDIYDDPTENDDAEETYRHWSLGPPERPWSFEPSFWNESITHLVTDKLVYVDREDQILGPRTEAWEYIQHEIRTGRVTTRKSDAAEHKIPYLDEDLDEIWVPNTIVYNACEDIACARPKLSVELHERGVDSDLVSGQGCSKPVEGQRMWRLDATHPEVPEPGTVVDSVSGGGFENVGSTDGGVATDGGTGSFGRDPDEDSDDSDDE